MQTFFEWIISETRQPQVDPSVLMGYEWELRRQLEALIQRTKDPNLKEKFLRMLDCPIVDSSGRCRDFTEYVLSALIKNGVHRKYDLEAALSYIMTQMLMDKSLQSGKERQTVFGGFEERPYGPGENPLQGRFLTYLTNAIRNITSGRIARLSDIKRPAGTISIGSGRSKNDEGFLSPEEIGAEPEMDQQELFSDIITLLQKKEEEIPGMPLVDLFRSMVAGETTRQQRAEFGYRNTDMGRKIVVQVIEDYAKRTDNLRLLNLLRTMQGDTPQSSKPRRNVKPQQPKLTPKQKDYASIISVLERKGGSVTHSVLGSLRRRWLERAPRDSSSRHKNRLDDVLAHMVDDGVLIEKQTGGGGRVYYPGENYEEYRQFAPV